VARFVYAVHTRQKLGYGLGCRRISIANCPLLCGVWRIINTGMQCGRTVFTFIPVPFTHGSRRSLSNRQATWFQNLVSMHQNAQ